MSLRTAIWIFCSALLAGCTEPVVPEFDFKKGLVAVEGLVSTSLGGSFVRLYRINEFNIGLNNYENVFISGAEVFFLNSDTGNKVRLQEDVNVEIYVPPSDFTGKHNETWELEINLADGRTYRSFPETIGESVPIDAIYARYDAELTYNAELDDFAPGHAIEVDFQDPTNTENYYYWNYRAFEIRDVCVVCHIFRIYRNDTCVLIRPQLPPEVENVHPYQTYYCENDCWQIRYNQDINIYKDKFSDGARIDRLPIGIVPLNTKRDILVEVQQFSFSPAAYQYYEALKDIVDDNGGFNSPPSAAMIGNMFNPNDSGEYVLGRFTAAFAETARIFLERDHLAEDQIEWEHHAPEGTWTEPMIPEEEYVFYGPCPEESRHNTSVRPEGWPTN